MAIPQTTLQPETSRFYREAMRTLQQERLPFMVGGAYAFARYTGIVRHTKDFDIFVHPRDFDRVLAALARRGWQVERSFPHWLGKAYSGDDFVDVIFGSGNAVARVDDRWFEHAPADEVLGVPVQLCPAEEMLWSKSLIMERERFDGADVAHLLRCRAGELDWVRLRDRFGEHWRVLLSHLVLFGYVYPGEADRLPAWLLAELLGRLREPEAAAAGEPLCRGTVLSRSQYLVDVESWGYRDARLEPVGAMTAEEIAQWTAAALVEAERIEEIQRQELSAERAEGPPGR
jgi:hypothetical protein